MDYYKICLLVCLWSVVESCTYCEQDVYRYLFLTTNYSKQVRPACKQDDLIYVNVSLTINSLLEINEKNEKMNIMAFFILVWQDPRLGWEPSSFFDVTDIVIPASEIWLPDVILSNSATSFYEYTYKRDFLVSILFTGHVTWAFGGVISTNCGINMSEYPFDTQNCSLNLETWSYSIEELELHLDDNPVTVRNDSKTNALWAFNGHQSAETTVYDGNFRRLIFTLSWKRRHLYYYFNILIPAIMLIAVALGVFWLPVESGEKVSLAVTLLLAFSVFLIIIMDNTPVNSLEIPVITTFVVLLMAVTTLALCLAIFLSYLNGKANRAPKWLRTLCLECLARVLCIDVCTNVDLSEDTDACNTFDHDWSSADVMKYFVNTKYLGKSNDFYDKINISKISDDLHKIVDYIDMQNKCDKIKEEWSAIGKVLDRLCFWISVIILAVLLPMVLLRII